MVLHSYINDFLKKLLCLTILVFCIKLSFAQQYKFSKLLIPYQIPELAGVVPLTDIIEDRLGFIWIGTQNGLYKFDGYTTVHYQFDPNSPEKLAGNWISALAEDDSGNIWMGIFGVGLQKLDPLTGKFTLYKPNPANKESLSDNRINYLLFHENKLWIDTQGGSCSFSTVTQKFKIYSKDASILTILKDDHKPWQVNCNIDYSILRPYHADEDKFAGGDTLHIKSTSVQLIAFLKDRLFLNIDGVVYIYNIKSKVLSPLNTGANDPVTASLYFNGRLFISCTSGKFETYDIEKNGLDIQECYVRGINKLIHLKNGDLWAIGYATFKIRIDDGGISTYSLIVDGNYIDLNNESLLSEWQPGFLGVGGGTQLDFNHLVALNTSSQNSPLKILDSSYSNNKDVNIYVDENKDSWIVFFDRSADEISFFKFSNLTRQLIKLGSMHEGHPLFGITKIGDDLWVATWPGMIKWNVALSTGVFIGKAGDSTKLSPASVRYCFKDRDNDLWVATQNGLYLKEKNKRDFAVFISKPGDTTALSFNGISTISQDSSGIIWIATQGGGLDQFNKKTRKFSWLTTKQGLVQNNIDNFVIDKKNNIWISYATGGIARINPVTKKILSYTIADGCFGYGENESITMSDGSLIFGGIGVFTRITPNKIKENKFIPSIFITDFKLFNQQVLVNGADSILHTNINSAQSITLNHNQNVFTLEYAALDMLSPDQRTYAYQLEGFDNGWQYVGSKREVTYTNLSPGHYVFKIKSVDRYGQWNEIKNPLQINILPPWWKTWWAYTLYALLFFLAIWAFVSYRSASLKKQNRILEIKVVNRTDQLKKSFEELKSTQAQLVQSEKMASLGELTAGIAHEIQNPLNFVNNFSEINKELVDELQTELKAGNTEDAITISNDIKENEEKINHHGKRADAIVKNMLQHSRKSTGQKEPTDINALADEYLRLSYHGMRAKDKSFNAGIKTDFDLNLSSGEKINIVPQDIGRVLLNLFNNAFYAVSEKASQQSNSLHSLQAGQAGYEPMILVSSKKKAGMMEVTVKDNGKGIPGQIVDKIFQPFFTTKPTGEGTGLGLSLSYDIIKAHGGELKVETKEGEGSMFTIQLPVV